MIKTTDKKEMESVIRDILNPFRDDIDIEYEAWNLTHEEGWHKQIEAEWLQFTKFNQPWVYECSNCHGLLNRMSVYCPDCGAKMSRPEGVE